MSRNPLFVGFAIMGSTVLTHPARLVGQDTLSAPYRVRAISGDPHQTGHFIVRVTFPVGSHTDPHHHSVDLTERIVRGRLLMGSSARFDTTRVVAFDSGSTTMVRAGQVHYDWWPDGGELEMEGDGPMQSTMADSLR